MNSSQTSATTWSRPEALPTEFDAGDYAAKPDIYYEQARPEMLPFVPRDCRRLLDVGCSNGSFGALIQRERGCFVWGVEPFAAAAAEAAKVLDKVIPRAFDEDAPLPRGEFDCVSFNDVLEHLLDPWTALRLSKKLLVPGGVVVASIPNIRHFPTLWHLAMHGEWEYRDCGTLDKTHLRFFTRSAIGELFEATGFTIERIEGIHPFRGIPNASSRVWRLFRLANILSGSRFADMKFERFAVVARSVS
jgi:SAM-dependent methyltransferase